MIWGHQRVTCQNRFYEKKEYLHRILKMRSTCTGIKIGNGAVIPVDFVFPVQIMIQGHLFEIYTIVAALHESIDLVIGMKNMVELEGILNTSTELHLISCCTFNPNLSTK